MIFFNKKVILLIVIFFLFGCNKKSEPIIKKDANLSIPIKCMALNAMATEKEFVEKLYSLYHFDNKCDLKLYVKYKKDIVCNSPYNPNSKNVSQFPKSFLKLELRRGLEIEYSYYIDLYDNIDEDDVEKAFLRLKKDIANTDSGY